MKWSVNIQTETVRKSVFADGREKGGDPNLKKKKKI